MQEMEAMVLRFQLPDLLFFMLAVAVERPAILLTMA
jgi:hypothetical protein